MGKTIRLVLVALCALLSWNSTGFADQTYTLRSLCRLADKHAETIRIAEDDVFIARQEKQRALSVLVPRATTFGSYLNNRNEDMTNPDTHTMGAKLTQSFTLNGRELVAFDVAKKGIELADYAKESIRADYLLEVARTCIQTVTAKRLVEIADSDVERLTVNRDSIQEKLNVGNVTKTDLFRAQAELSRSMTDKINAENSVGQLKAALVRLTGVADEFDVTLSQNALDKVKNLSFDLDDISQQALSNRYEVRQAQKDTEIAARTIDFEKGDFWPEISLEGGYQESDISYSSTDTDSENAYVQAELVFTLFDGGLRRAQVRQAQANERQARQALSLTKKEVVQEAKVALLEFETARNSLINLQDELKSAQENYNAVTMQFKYGMADIINLMDANTTLVTAERRILEAEYSHYLAYLIILYTKGELMEYLLIEAGS